MVGGGAEQVALEVDLGLALGVRPALGRQLGETRLVQRRGVGEAGHDDVVSIQLEVARGLDRRQQVADRGDAEQRQLVDEVVGDAATQQRLAPRRLVEHPQQPHRRLVIDRGDEVGGADVVNPRHVLVADPLDAVAAEPGRQQRRALQRLGDRDRAAGVGALEEVARSQRAGGAGGAHPRGQPPARTGDGGKRLLGRGAGDAEVPEVVPELLELVEDHRLRLGLADLPAGVEDLLDVGLAPRRRDDLGADRGEPLEALAAHLLGEDRHRVAAQQRRVECAAAAVVAGRGPHRLLRHRVELPRHQPRHQTTERRADLVRAGREVAPDEADDAGRHPRQLGGDHERVHWAEAAGRRVVVPGDAEEVERIHGLHVDPGQPRGDCGVDRSGVTLLADGRDHDAALPAALHRVLARIPFRLVGHVCRSRRALYRFCRGPAQRVST